MKNHKLIRLLCLILCAVMLFAGCASDDESDKKEKKATEAPKPAGEESGPAEEPTGEATPAAKPGVPASYDFSSVDSHIEKMIREAVEQYNKEDYTPLDEPVKYYVLWLGFTHVTFGDLDFQMTDFDRDYLEAVTLNYEKSVESISNHNVDITVYFHLIDDTVPLTQAAGADWLYLDMQTVMPYITHYMEGREIDTVLTTVQTAGEENRARNEGKDGYGVHDVMLGLKTEGIESPLGYSTFNLVTPAAGTYPLADPEIPSLYATAVAVHEWMHQLEYLETLLGVEYPDTHAYMGPESYPGYEKYTADLNDYDFFEFYKLVLTGKCPYTGNGSVKHVGMYPKMWPLIKRNVFNLGNFTIKAADGSGYLVGREAEIGLTLGDEECVWNISYSGNGRFVLKPKDLPNMRIDLGNAWDIEGNTVGIWVYTGYEDAQSWHLSLNDDGTYSIKTPYPSGRVVTAKKGEKALLNTLGAAEGAQKWIIEAR